MVIAKIHRLLFVLWIYSLSSAFAAIQPSPIVDSCGKVRPEVVAVFREYKKLICEHKDDIIKKTGLLASQIDHILDNMTSQDDISLVHLNHIAQTIFLRPASMERKDTKGLREKYLPYTTKKVFDLFQGIGDIDDVYPSKNSYDYILINGSTVGNMRVRLKTLMDLVTSGKIILTPQTTLVFLTGERDLFPEEDEPLLMSSDLVKFRSDWVRPSVLPQTEDQAAEWIWNQTDLPEELRQAKIVFVRAKKKTEIDSKTGEVKVKRPTTADTVQTWIEKEQPTPGTCLSISDQPYVYYQQLTMTTCFKKAGLLDKGFSVEGVGLKHRSPQGDEAQFKENIQIVLDNFARTIYTELSLKN